MTTLQLVLLSSLNNIIHTLMIFSGIATIVSVFTCAISSELNDTRDNVNKRVGQCWGWAKKLFITTGIFAILNGLVPTPHTIITAHVMAEGVKVLTAENVEKLATEILNRIK